MKMQELTNVELQEVNGGSIFGGSDTSSSQSGLLGSLGIDNLFSGSTSSRNGDQSNSSSTSIGNGIGADLGGIFNQFGRQS